MKNKFGEEVVNVSIRLDLLNEIQELSINTNEIYEDQSFEDFVNNILVMEKLRIQKLQGNRQ